MLRLLLYFSTLLFLAYSQTPKDTYAVTKHFRYDDGTVEECICTGFNPDPQNDEASAEGRSKRATKETEDPNLPSVKARNQVDKTRYSVNKRIDFSGDGYEDCACTPKTKRVSRRIRALSGLPHHLISRRRNRRSKPRVDSWLATSYEEDDKKERHYKFENTKNVQSSTSKGKTNEDKTLDELLNDVPPGTTKKPSKSNKKSKGKEKGAGGKGKTRARRYLEIDDQ